MTAFLIIVGLLVGPIVLAEFAIAAANRLWPRRADEYAATMETYAERKQRATPTRSE